MEKLVKSVLITAGGIILVSLSFKAGRFIGQIESFLTIIDEFKDTKTTKSTRYCSYKGGKN